MVSGEVIITVMDPVTSQLVTNHVKPGDVVFTPINLVALDPSGYRGRPSAG